MPLDDIINKLFKNYGKILGKTTKKLSYYVMSNCAHFISIINVKPEWYVNLNHPSPLRNLQILHEILKGGSHLDKER